MKFCLLFIIVIISVGCASKPKYSYSLYNQNLSNEIKNFNRSSLLAVMRMDISSPRDGSAGAIGGVFGVLGALVAVAIEASADANEIDTVGIGLQKITLNLLEEKFRIADRKYIPVDSMSEKSEAEISQYYSSGSYYGFDKVTPEEVTEFFTTNPRVDFGIEVFSKAHEFKSENQLILSTRWNLYGQDGIGIINVFTRSIKNDHKAGMEPEAMLKELKTLQQINILEFLNKLNEIDESQANLESVNL